MERIANMFGSVEPTWTFEAHRPRSKISTLHNRLFIFKLHVLAFSPRNRRRGRRASWRGSRCSAPCHAPPLSASTFSSRRAPRPTSSPPTSAGPGGRSSSAPCPVPALRFGGRASRRRFAWGGAFLSVPSAQSLPPPSREVWIRGTEHGWFAWGVSLLLSRSSFKELILILVLQCDYYFYWRKVEFLLDFSSRFLLFPEIYSSMLWHFFPFG